MTPKDNEALVRRGYEAFGAADLATLTGLIAENACFVQPGTSAVSGDHRGRDAVLAYFGRLARVSQGTFRVEIESLFASDRTVVAVHRASGELPARSLRTRTALVFSIADGAIARFEAVQEDQAAFDAFFAG